MKRMRGPSRVPFRDPHEDLWVHSDNHHGHFASPLAEPQRVGDVDRHDHLVGHDDPCRDQNASTCHHLGNGCERWESKRDETFALTSIATTIPAALILSSAELVCLALKSITVLFSPLFPFLRLPNFLRTLSDSKFGTFFFRQELGLREYWLLCSIGVTIAYLCCRLLLLLLLLQKRLY